MNYMVLLWGSAAWNFKKFHIDSTSGTRDARGQCPLTDSAMITKCKGNGFLSQIKTTVEGHLPKQFKKPTITKSPNSFCFQNNPVGLHAETARMNYSIVLAAS